MADKNEHCAATLADESFFDSRAAILAAIPHRPPFLFVDKILEWTDEQIKCSYRFKEDEFFFEGHYPGSPVVPGVILCESAMQVGAIFMTRLMNEEERASGKKPAVGRMYEIKFKSPAHPGDTIEQTVSLKEKMGAVYILRAKVVCEGKLAVVFEFAVTMTENL